MTRQFTQLEARHMYKVLKAIANNEYPHSTYLVAELALEAIDSDSTPETGRSLFPPRYTVRQSAAFIPFDGFMLWDNSLGDYVQDGDNFPFYDTEAEAQAAADKLNGGGA